MPNPTMSDVHVNTPLTNLSIAYQNNIGGYIADRVFPAIAVPKQSGLYYRYARDDWYRSEAQLRAPGTESAGGGYRLDTDTYFAHVYAVHKDIDEQIAANADDAINMDRDATQWVTNQLLLKREKLWVSNFFQTSIWGSNQAGVASAPGSNQFVRFDVAGSVPIETLRAQILAQQQLTGYTPNTLVMGAQVWNALADHAEFLDRIKYTQRGMVTEDLLASLLGIDRVFVARAVEVTTAEEAAADTYSFLLGKSMLLCYAAPNPGTLQPSAGYTFNWTGYLGANANGMRMSTLDMPWIRSRRVEGELAFDMKLVAAELGTFFSAVVA